MGRHMTNPYSLYPVPIKKNLDQFQQTFPLILEVDLQPFSMQPSRSSLQLVRAGNWNEKDLSWRWTKDSQIELSKMLLWFELCPPQIHTLKSYFLAYKLIWK